MINYTLLEKLAAHLERGQHMTHTEFNFSHIAMIRKNEHFCGTSGCAIGELPAITNDVVIAVMYEDGINTIQQREQYSVFAAIAYRKECGQHPSGYWTKLHTSASDSATVARETLGLNIAQYSHLFVPHYQKTKTWGGVYLNEDATRQEVASNIREFIKKQKQYESATA